MNSAAFKMSMDEVKYILNVLGEKNEFYDVSEYYARVRLEAAFSIWIGRTLVSS
jgi:hypothetical protein